LRRTLILAFTLLAASADARWPGLERSFSDAQAEARGAGWARFLAGATAGLLAHEAGHLVCDLALDTRPELRPVEFLGIPFVAIAPTAPMSPRERYVVTSAGFWMQHAASEWILTRRPGLRSERAPFRKGLLAFHVLTSAGYSVAAFAHAGPAERDTRGMALGLGVDERWIGAMVLAPAVLDAVRYRRPRARWAKWASRGIKLGLVALALK
jgi:hypothetical protein